MERCFSELVPEEWGGDVICVPVSAHTKMGIDDLLENILLIADVKEYKANPAKRARGVVIEAKRSSTAAAARSQPFSFRTVRSMRVTS